VWPSHSLGYRDHQSISTGLTRRSRLAGPPGCCKRSPHVDVNEIDWRITIFNDHVTHTRFDARLSPETNNTCLASLGRSSVSKFAVAIELNALIAPASDASSSKDDAGTSARQIVKLRRIDGDESLRRMDDYPVPLIRQGRHASNSTRQLQLSGALLRTVRPGSSDLTPPTGVRDVAGSVRRPLRGSADDR
jgi:hypothetical protein